MSTILVNTLTGTSTAGSIAVTSEGGSATTNLQNGLIKAFATINAYTATTEANNTFNISSTTDDGAGLWDNAYTNNMSADRYSVSHMATGGLDNDSTLRSVMVRSGAHTNSNPTEMLTTGCGFVYRYVNTSSVDEYGYAFCSIQVIGDLA